MSEFVFEGPNLLPKGQILPLYDPRWPILAYLWLRLGFRWPLLAFKWPKLASQWPCGSLNGRSWSLAGSDDLQIVLIGLQMAWEGPNYHVSTPLLRPRFPQKLPGYSQKARGHPWWAPDTPQFLWTLEFRYWGLQAYEYKAKSHKNGYFFYVL